MIKNKLDNYLQKRRCTLLGVGPMSKNCVDATIELANDSEAPLMLIASRRQIDAEEFGGGYVNNWTTEEYARYVIENDKKGKVILARDHGGPWQNPIEIDNKLSLRQAMESAKKSYHADIKSGFEIIHIDPSVDIYSSPNVDEVLLRVFELMEYCHEVATKYGKKIEYEIGTEEQSGGNNSIEEIEYVLDKVRSYCSTNKLPFPMFIVLQSGTKVLETRNVGTLDTPFRIAHELPAEIQVPRILEICDRYNIYFKEHNTDYLNNESLSMHPKFGIHAANVAPEFGVAETKAFIKLLEENKLNKLKDEFVDLAFNSRKWEKWMLPNSTNDKLGKAIIAGHYVFSKPEMSEIKLKAQASIKGVNIDEYLKYEVKHAILRYMKCFRLSN